MNINVNFSFCVFIKRITSAVISDRSYSKIYKNFFFICCALKWWQCDLQTTYLWTGKDPATTARVDWEGGDHAGPMSSVMRRGWGHSMCRLEWVTRGRGGPVSWADASRSQTFSNQTEIIKLNADFILHTEKEGQVTPYLLGLGCSHH